MTRTMIQNILTVIMTKADIVYQTFKSPLCFKFNRPIAFTKVTYDYERCDQPDLYELSCQTACGQMFSFYQLKVA